MLGARGVERHAEGLVERAGRRQVFARPAAVAVAGAQFSGAQVAVRDERPQAERRGVLRGVDQLPGRLLGRCAVGQTRDLRRQAPGFELVPLLTAVTRSGEGVIVTGT